MAGMETVVKGLRCLAQTEEPMANPCAKCDYKDRANFAFCVVDVAKDAIELLKEQQPRLYERSELYPFESTESIVWFESAGMGIIPGLITNIKEPYYANILIVNGCTTDVMTWTMDYYGRYWRCWTARPTDEQRKAEPWKEGKQE